MRAFEPTTPRRLQVTAIDGVLPLGLRGTFHRIGPGTLAVGADPNRHWFDGDGLICAFRFSGDGRLEFESRHVETPWFRAEQAAGRRLFSGFATVAPGVLGHLRLPKNPANTNVVTWNGRLLALYEAARPFALDPHSLAASGTETFGGTLPAWSAFSAHPHHDRVRHTLVSVGLSLRVDRHGPYPVAEVWNVSAAGRASRGRTIRLAHADVLHSVGLTPNHLVLLAGPYGLEPRRLPDLLRGRIGLFDCAQWRPDDPLIIYLADRDGDAPARRIELPARFVIHVANAFERPDRAVVVDAVVHPNPALIDAIRLPMTDFPQRPGLLTRFVCHRDGRVEEHRLADAGLEFPTLSPTLDGRPHRHVYAAQLERVGERIESARLFKIDTENGEVRSASGTTAIRTASGTATIASANGPVPDAPQTVLGEPVFVPRDPAKPSEEDDGWVLSLGYDGRDHHSFLTILDAQRWVEVARAHLPFHVPLGLHASFTAA